MAVAVRPDTIAHEDAIEQLELAAITPAPDNPRRDLGDVAELAASMHELGMLQPLVVTPRQGKFMVVCGHRRYAAARKAKLAHAPAIIRELDEPQRIKAMLIENCQREDLDPLEEARGYQQLVDLGLTQRQIAGDVGKSQGHISKRLSLLEIPKPAQAALDSGGITLEEAQELAKLRDDPKRQEHAWKQRGQVYGGLARAIEDELEAKRHDEAIAAEEAKLEKKGIRTVKARRLPYGYELPAGAIAIRKGGGYDALKLDPAVHASEPCHAVCVLPPGRYGTRQVELVDVCTDRKRHPKAKTGEESYSTPRSESQAQRDARELSKATPTRRAFAGVLARGRVGRGGLAKTDRAELLLDTLIRSAHSEVLKVACRMLELDTAGGSFRDFGKSLHEHAAASAIKREQTELAIAFATHEKFMTDPWNGWDEHRGYVTLLEQHGYEISPIEAKKLGRKRTKKAAA